MDVHSKNVLVSVWKANPLCHAGSMPDVAGRIFYNREKNVLQSEIFLIRV